METFAILTFALVIYIMCTMPTKKEIRRLLNADSEDRRRVELLELLKARKGSSCAISLNEVHYVANKASLEGELVDIDDDWVLVRATGKKGATQLVAVRLENVEGLDE